MIAALSITMTLTSLGLIALSMAIGHLRRAVEVLSRSHFELADRFDELDRDAIRINRKVPQPQIHPDRMPTHF
jgi:hypothetical protein